MGSAPPRTVLSVCGSSLHSLTGVSSAPMVQPSLPQRQQESANTGSRRTLTKRFPGEQQFSKCGPWSPRVPRASRGQSHFHHNSRFYLPSSRSSGSCCWWIEVLKDRGGGTPRQAGHQTPGAATVPSATGHVQQKREFHFRRSIMQENDNPNKILTLGTPVFVFCDETRSAHSSLAEAEVLRLF